MCCTRAQHPYLRRKMTVRECVQQHDRSLPFAFVGECNCRGCLRQGCRVLQGLCRCCSFAPTRSTESRAARARSGKMAMRHPAGNAQAQCKFFHIITHPALSPQPHLPATNAPEDAVSATSAANGKRRPLTTRDAESAALSAAASSGRG